jgi:NADH dehydrogenase
LSKKFRGRDDIKITLVDKSECQTFTPALYEVASIYGIDHEHPYHTKLRGVISIPYSEIFSARGGSAFGGQNKNVNLVQAEINHIDLTAKHVVTNSGTIIDFDYLIVAFGSTVSTFGIPGVEEYAYKFKTIEDALLVNDKLEELYVTASKAQRPLPINILVGGAGFNGVELAAELSNCTIHIAHRHAINQQNCTSVTLIEAGPVILPMVFEKERNLIQKRLKSLGVNVMVNSIIEEVGPDYIKLKNGDIRKGDLIVWSGGIKALDIFKSVVGLELDDHSRIFVNEFLQVKNRREIFAMGDNMIFIDQKTHKPIPQMAYLAVEQGRVVAENIFRLVEGGERQLKKYEPSYNVWIAPVGGKYALAHIGSRTFSGFIGYVIREVVDLRYFLSVLPFWNAVRTFFRGVRAFSKND